MTKIDDIAVQLTILATEVGRIGERTQNLWAAMVEGDDSIKARMDETKIHQIKQNGLLQKHTEIVSSNCTWIRAFQWLIGVLITGILALAGWITKSQGLW